MPQAPNIPQSAAEETWRIFRIMAEFVEGFETMSRVPPAVSVFGKQSCARQQQFLARFRIRGSGPFGG